MKILIVEDETFAFTNIKNILGEIEPQIDIVANTDSVSQTVEWLKKNPHPDLIFMDIHLADGPAFNIFKCIDVDVPVIFATAYDEYAIEAFKVNSVDYLLKPINKNDVERSLAKFKKFSNNDLSAYLDRISESIKPSRYSDSILIAYKDKIIPVPCEEIYFFHTANERSTLTTADGNNYPVDKSLDSIFVGLDPKKFYRANRRYIISRNSIKDITVWFDSRLLINTKITAPEQIFISKNRTSNFKAWLAGS
ncbi:MAG: LytTR family DNA-binding domain-containing protein [Rikenellaceae bacterium]|nr:LytTR family DNA-binding domain-containing protein [Rikenellaceae bacterium]